MSVILINKKKFSNLLKEAGPTGDSAATSVAKAQGGLEKAKERLAKLSIVSIPGLNSINTLDQLSIEPFKFNFLLQVKDDPQGLSLPIPHQFDTLARVVKKEPLVLEVKTDSDLLFKMVFPKKEELITQLSGTKEPIVGKSNKVIALVSEGDGKKGKFYTIKFNNAKKVVGQAEKENTKKKLKRKKRKTVESYINEIAKKVILIKEDNEESQDPDKIKNSIGKIYIKSIELGPKASARAGEERESFTKNINQWNGNLNNLPKAQVGSIPASVKVNKLVIDLVDKNLSKDQQTVFNQIKGILGKSNFEGNTTIRRSAKSPSNTIVISFPTIGGNKAIICKILNNETDLKKYLEVEVAPKIAGKDDFKKSTKAKIQIR